MLTKKGVSEMTQAQLKEMVKQLAFGAALAAGFVAVLFILKGLEVPNKQAEEVRLLGFCNGKLLAAKEEDQFPTGCLWIEPVNHRREVVG